jgi:hypothetical protein
LNALRNRPASESVVVYLALYALVDDKGAVQVLGTDSDPEDPETMLPLSDVLKGLAACPSKSKLLILDITRPLSLPGPIGLGDNVADHIADEVKVVKDDYRLVLVSCAPGQHSLGSETLGASAFNHFFRLGLAGAAETRRDKRIDVKELAQYLRKAVDDWAVHNLGLHQRPVLLGSGPDFDLVAVTERKTPPPTAPALAEKDKVKEKESGKEKGAGPPAEMGYPKWLTDGWAERESWWRSNDLLTAPRAFRMLEAALLKAEHDWHGGGDPAEIRRLFDRRLRDIRAERDRSRPSPPQPFRSVGQALAYDGWRPDPELVAALKALVKAKRRRDPFLPPEKQAENLKAAAKEFLGKFKDKANPSLDLAGTIVAAAEDDRPDATTVSFLNSLVADSVLGYDLVETRFLRYLSARFDQGPPPVDLNEENDRDEAIRQAWGVITLAERTNNRPYALAWVRDVLDEAEASRHLGEVLLQPDAAGFASWAKIADVWKQALEGDGYSLVNGTQERIRDAQFAVRRALAVLPAFVSYLETGARPDLEDVWLKATKATQDLLPMLQTPEPGSDGPVILTADLLRSRNSELRAATEALDRLLNDLMRPFRNEAVLGLLKRCESDKADPQAVREIDAALATPFLAPADRATLWAAGRSLALRLASLPLKPEETAAALATPGNDLEIALRRAGRLAALLALSGQDVSSLQEKLDALETLPSDGWEKERPELVHQLRLAWTRMFSQLKQSGPWEDQDRLGSIAPIVAINWQTNPIRRRLEREAAANRAWLLEHYQHEGREQIDPERFYQAAAIDCTPAGELPPEHYAEFPTAGSEAKATLTAEQNSIRRTLRIILHDPNADQAQEVELNVISPGDSRLSITPASRVLKLTRETPAPASFQVVWNEGDAPGRRAPAGFIVQARLKNKRNYHTRVPLNIIRNDERLRLILSGYPKKATAGPFDLRLRTLPGRQLFYLYVHNPSPTPRDVRVEILKGDAPDPVESVRLTAKERTATKVPTFGAPTLKPDQLLPELDGPLTIRIVDEKNQQVLDQQRLLVEIASATDLVQVTRTRYTPRQPGEPNHLSISLQADPNLAGPPCPVELVLSEKFIPNLTGPPKGDAHLSGNLEPGSKLVLDANDLPLDPSQSEKGYFQLNIDGRKRALWYRTNFTQEGGPQTPVEDQTPRIRFKAQPVIEPGKPSHLDVNFEVDNPPPKASLEFRLIRVGGGTGPDEVPAWREQAKNRHLGFDARGADGALQFEANLDDWSHSVETSNIRGERVLRAVLLDTNNKRVASFEQTVLLDDQPPRDIQFGPLPVRVMKGTTALVVRAGATPPISGIKEVEFFLGKKADSATAAKVPGEPVDGTYEATLDPSKVASGPIFITVRFVSGSGLDAFATTEVGLTAPPPPPPAAGANGAAKAEPALGSIKGKVLQNDLPQPDRTVSLYVLTPEEKYKKSDLQAKTGPDGTYLFKDLKPGKYAVTSSNDALGTRGQAEATVEPGKAASANIELFK